MSIPLPHEQRDSILSPVAFEHLLAERGWTITHVRQPYTDVEVFRQQWLVCPNGVAYPQRVQSFHPDVALLLIDTSTPFAQIRIDTFNHALHYLGYPLLVGKGGFYRGPNNISIVNVGISIAVSLNDVLR